jgi:predicted dehydrogenase
MKRQINWGVIGCGGIASRRAIPEMKQDGENAKLVSVMDANPARAAEVAKRFGVPHHCADEGELLAQDLQAVYIASPPQAHTQQTIRAAQAGKHILCEKPMALTAAEADEMAQACQSAGVSFMLGLCMRQNLYHAKARELVHAGVLGRPVMGRAQLTCWYPPIPGAWRQDLKQSGGGALMDMGVHCLDLLEWIFDSRIIEVAGFQDQLVQRYATPIDDTSTVVARFANGTHGIVDTYYNLPDAAAQNTLELHGTGGSLMAQGTIGQEPTGRMFGIFHRQGAYEAEQTRSAAPRREEFHFEGRGIYGQMIAQFSQCLLDQQPPSITAADGRRTVALLQAIYRAGRERRVVTVESYGN